MSVRRRRFGSVRRLPSGRWQVRYRSADGRTHLAPDTFATKTDADRFLAQIETDMLRGHWIDPTGGRVTLQVYTQRWLAHRGGLAAKTRQEYERSLRLHILPTLGDMRLDAITADTIRGWHAGRVAAGTGKRALVNAYALLRAIFSTATDDGLVARTPCRIGGATRYNPAPRPAISLADIQELTEAMPSRYRAAVLLAVWGHLRFGEIAALRVGQLDLEHGSVRVTEQVVDLDHGQQVRTAPKTTAGLRTVALPPHLIPILEQHLESLTSSDVDALVFTDERGRALTRRRFHYRWDLARRAVGLPHVHFHDLRGAGLTIGPVSLIWPHRDGLMWPHFRHAGDLL